MSAIRQVALQEVAQIEREIVAASDIDDGTLYVGLENIESGGRLVNVRPVDAGELLSNKFAFTPRHMLYGKLRPYLAKIARPDFQGICSTDILPVLPGPDLDRGYLAWLLLSPEMVSRANSRASGANLPRLSPKALAELQIPLPSLPEQRRIAEILDKADALRAKRRAALAQLDIVTQSIFLEMFGDPATNPKGWPRMAFGQVCETRLGKMLDQKKQTGEHRRPYLRNANVQWFRFDLASLFEMDFDENDRRTLRVLPGDLLICEGGEPGRAAVWQGALDECYFQKALHRARPDPKLAYPDYLSWLLWFLTHRGKLSGVTSATIAHLTGEKLAVLPCMLPPLPLQAEFANRLADVRSLERRHLAALAEADALFAALQHRAFRGEL
ncbi:MAG: restriction endonuclease subunit S [Gemmatimonadota bacterium]